MRNSEKKIIIVATYINEVVFLSFKIVNNLGTNTYILFDFYFKIRFL